MHTICSFAFVVFFCITVVFFICFFCVIFGLFGYCVIFFLGRIRVWQQSLVTGMSNRKSLSVLILVVSSLFAFLSSILFNLQLFLLKIALFFLLASRDLKSVVGQSKFYLIYIIFDCLSLISHYLSIFGKELKRVDEHDHALAVLNQTVSSYLFFFSSI